VLFANVKHYIYKYISKRQVGIRFFSLFLLIAQRGDLSQKKNKFSFLPLTITVAESINNALLLYHHHLHASRRVCSNSLVDYYSLTQFKFFPLPHISLFFILLLSHVFLPLFLCLSYAPIMHACTPLPYCFPVPVRLCEFFSQRKAQA